MNSVKRYEWEDALIEAECLGLLESGAVNMCLRLAKAITWEPKKGKRAGWASGLYWKNEEALKSVRSSKATYHRHREALFEVGFFIEEGGNLIPQVPDLSQIETPKSQIETPKSQIETGKSQIETGKSQIDSPYTVDKYTGDISSGDKCSVASVADAPEAANLDSHEPQNTSDSDTSSESLSSGISESSLPTVPVDDSTSHESSTFEPTINEGDLGEPARPARPANISRGQLKAAAEMLGVVTIDSQRRTIYAFETNRAKIVSRASNSEFDHLPTAEARCEAALDAILEERVSA